jgi:hypothetical protein
MSRMGDYVVWLEENARTDSKESRLAYMATVPRPLYVIAREIVATWPNVYFGAKPYLDAMLTLSYTDELYGMDSADSIVRYFLVNAKTWRGDDARRIKTELKGML